MSSSSGKSMGCAGGGIRNIVGTVNRRDRRLASCFDNSVGSLHGVCCDGTRCQVAPCDDDLLLKNRLGSKEFTLIINTAEMSNWMGD